MSILDDLLQIENRLEVEGDSKQVRHAFWRIVGKMKRRAPSEVTIAEIDKATEIRNRLFRQPVIMGVSKGLLIFFLIALFSYVAFIWVLLSLEFHILLLNAILFFLSIFALYGVYPLGRYLGGRIARVQFEGFYRYSPGELGLKIEYASYLKTTQSRRKWVFGFPIIWVFGFLFLEMAIAWVLNPLGLWAPLIFLISFPFFYVAITFRKLGELYRFLRELRIEREVKQKQ
ncbi:MAG: hypothetical protein ACE5R6_02265 [Candidatus Heimdallarchaeota archaeon]